MRLVGIVPYTELRIKKGGAVVRSESYFKSKFNSKLRKTDPKFVFQDAKILAYKAASEGISAGFTQDWADQYVNNKPPSSTLWWFEDMIRLYADFLTGKKSKEDSERNMSEIESEWNESEIRLQAILNFRKTAEEAFVAKGIEFGIVEFTCPICGGNASSSKKNTPHNPAHAISIREGCITCGYTSMN